MHAKRHPGSIIHDPEDPVSRRHAQDNTLIYSTGQAPLDIQEDAMARRYSFDLIHSSLLSFLYGAPLYNLEALRHLETFLSFPVVSLLAGCVYLERYLLKTSMERGNCHTFIKLYLACCLIATKYNDDTRILNSPVVSGWGLCTSEINSLEMDVLSSLDFDLDIPTETMMSVLGRRTESLEDRRDIEVIYSYIVKNG